MNKWTAIGILIFATLLGGLYWFFAHQKPDTPPSSSVLPTEADMQAEEFETESDLAETEDALEDESRNPSPGTSDQSDKKAFDPIATPPASSKRPAEEEDAVDDAVDLDDDPTIQDDPEAAPAPTPIPTPASPGP